MSSNGSADTFLPRAFLALRSFVLVAAIVAIQGVLPLSVQGGDATERHIAGAGIPPLATTRVASGLIRPVFVASPPGDFDRLFIVEKRGVIRILDLNTNTINPTQFLNIDAIVTGGNSNNSEQGLLCLAFHPDYENNGFFYVNYTGVSGAGDTFISRYTVSADPDVADPGSASIVLSFNQPQGNHNGGWIGFGPLDGYLYIATGDGGNFCDIGSGHSTGGNAQDITNNLLGKMLRIDIDGGNPFAIPPDNPFAGISGDDEIWIYGLRNPWRNSFDRLTGDLYIGDVGQDAREEIDFQPSDSPGGENYGWNCMEGNGCASASGCGAGGCTCGSASLKRALHDYTHNPPPPPAGFVCAVTGGYVYRGCSIPQLQGTYFFGDFCGNAIWSFKEVEENVTEFADRTPELSPSLEGVAVNQIASFGEDALGEIYIVDQGSGTSGQIFKIIPESFAGPDCNENGVHDDCDIASGTSPDDNGNGVPDECDGPDCGSCPTDADGSGDTGAFDLAALLACWGPVVPGCECLDADDDGNIGAFDLASLLAIWGPCP